MIDLEQDIANKLLQLKAFSIQTQHPFTWANGWQSPIYLDDRKILSYPSARNFFKLELARVVAENYPDTDTVAGIAINAIAHSMLVAEQLSLPLVYVYPFPKDHGMENQIEGDLRPRQNVIVVENQVSGGDHAMRVIEAVRNNGCQVLGLVTIFNYEFTEAMNRFRENNVEVIALTTYSALLEQLTHSKQYSPDVLKVLKKWHQNPLKWKK